MNVVRIKTPRDSQRSKVYKAERRMSEHMGQKMTLCEVSNFVDKVVFSARFKALTQSVYHGIPVTIGDGRGRTSACAIGYHTIKLPNWSRTKLVVLHELAHIAVTRSKDMMAPSHGWQFCHAYLALVRTFMGVDAGDRLKGHFKEMKVRYKAPRQLSAETLAALRQRGVALAASRRPQP